MSTTADQKTPGAATPKPLPIPDSDTAPFWEGCREHVLRLQHCRACDRYQFYPRALCRHCSSDDLAWKEASGEGVIYTYTVARRAAGPAFADDVPYVVAIIELKEGPRLLSNVVVDDIETIRIGAAVRVVFEDVSDEITLPKFAPV